LIIEEFIMLPRINKIQCYDADYLLFATNDVISNVLYRTGYWEKYLIDISNFLLNDVQAPLVLDVGANLGAYSIPLAKNISERKGKVIGFEPQRIIYYQLCGNIVLNGLDNYYAYNQAVGDYDGVIEVSEINYEANHNIGAFSLDSKYRSQLDVEKYMLPENSTIQMVRLDGLKINNEPSLIKIDVEGYELNVLKGSVNFLEKFNYPPILFEAWNFKSFDEDRKELLDFVKYLGYEISLNIGQEYIAQHPKYSRYTKFLINADGSVRMLREK